MKILGLKHGHSPLRSQAQRPLYGKGIAGYRKGVVNLFTFLKALIPPTQILLLHERRRGIKAADGGWGFALFAEPLNGMGNDGNGAGMVIG